MTLRETFATRNNALDGLRGIAVLLVILAHAGVPYFAQAGAVGVTMFFVLSGFLITRLLKDEHQRSGRISLRRFYGRRARRLLPALMALVLLDGLARLAAGVSLVPVVAAATYSSNIAATFGVPLLELSHIWSLSLEEQFYLVWPVLLLLLVRTRFAVPALAVAIIASAALRVGLLVGGAGSVRVSFAPDTRADALLVGCLLALTIHRLRRPSREVAAVSAVLLGAFCFVGGWVMMWVLLPAAVCSAAIVWWSLDHHGWLACRPLMFVGTISYGLYLWHYPVAVLVLAWFGPAGLPITLVVSFGIAVVSWFVIERPFMQPRSPVAALADGALH